MEFGPHYVIIIILRQKHSRTRRISEVDERRLTSPRPMASLYEEQRDESLRFHLGGLMTRSGYLDSRRGDRQAQTRMLANPSENPRGPIFAELTAALDSVRTLKNFCFSNGRIPTARDPIDRNPEVDSGGSGVSEEPTIPSFGPALGSTRSSGNSRPRLNVRLCGYVSRSVRFANDYANHQDYCLRLYEEGHSRPGYAGGDHISHMCTPDNEGMTFHRPMNCPMRHTSKWKDDKDLI
ncbi:hypothetical protein ALC53_09971 [Atta colombica]|uniref:Uncharacterized protein n=1 Tax=Atta colombica TaxID=520822 RepID=A0A195B5J1_9HYME|nr:hypothetical protein ALC53_09971 [Atta colombica]